MMANDIPPGFQDLSSFGLIEALLGRRSRRFFMGAEIPDGVFTYKSRHKAVPLTDLDFYDGFYKPGAYLKTHETHMERWHSGTD